MVRVAFGGPFIGELAGGFLGRLDALAVILAAANAVALRMIGVVAPGVAPANESTGPTVNGNERHISLPLQSRTRRFVGR